MVVLTSTDLVADCRLMAILQANAYVPGWGATIFASANEMLNNSIVRKRLGDILAKSESEKQWWEQRRETIRSDFMKEIEDDEKAKA